jgi:ElaB/YqjD/DUF883 family membrane-anchored ribosome-binding protein
MRQKTENGDNVDLETFLEDLKTVVRDGEQLLKASASGMAARARAGAESTDRMVRSHPYQTLGLVLGIGLVLGLLLAGSSGSASEMEEPKQP